MRRNLEVFVAAVLVLASAPREAVVAAQPAGAATPTFTHDVAPILFKHCANCHRPGQIAPMSLLTYEETRPWARSIRNKVTSREMPPWFAAPDSLKFRNDRTMTQAEIDTIGAWVAGGAPEGDKQALPKPPQFSDEWVYGKPDYIIEMPVEFQIPAEGEVPVITYYTKLPFAEERYLQKVEMKPSNVAVVHHANVHFERLTVPAGAQYADGQFIGPDRKAVTLDRVRGDVSVFDVAESQLISYVPGRGYEEYWPGSGKVLPPGEWLVWTVHYTPTGKPKRDRTRIGLYFAKEPVRNIVITSQLTSWQTSAGVVAGTLVVEGKELVPDKPGVQGRVQSPYSSVPTIPPYAENWRIQAVIPIQEAITLYGFQPHAHLRCKDWKYVVTYPDGREEVLLSIHNYSFEWQLHYELAEPKKIPAGSRITALGSGSV